MKKIFAMIAIAWNAIFKRATNTDVIVEVPQINITVETINHVIDTVNNVKKVVESPYTAIALDFIPGTLDNKIAALIEGAIVPVMAGLTFVKGSLDSTTSQSAAIGIILSKVKLSDDADKDAFYHSLAARLIVVASDGKVTWSEAASLIELYFKQVFKG